MIYTGLESYTDAELIAMIERQDNPLAHELLRRGSDCAKELEDYKATVEALEVDLEEAREKSGMAALEEKLGETQRDLKGAKKEVDALAALNKRIQDNFDKLKAAYEARIAKLERQIADAPATW